MIPLLRRKEVLLESRDRDRYRISLVDNGVELLAQEPTGHEFGVGARSFARWYSEDYNRGMMGGLTMTRDEVLECFEEAREKGDRVFFLYKDGELAGDADFRLITPPAAEFAIMIGSRTAQGQGLGTAFSRMLHTFAFDTLGLSIIYLTVLAKNAAGRRCYEKVGYRVDESEAARAHVEDENDVPMSVTRDEFERRSREAMKGVVIGKR